jgi:membrane-bound ClpP family serine protease
MDWLTVILLIVAGIALIIIEILFIPGTTVIGIIGVALLVFGIIFGYGKFGNTTGTIILISTVVVGGAATFFSFRSGLWRTFALKGTSNSRVNEDMEIQHLLGAEGRAVSALRPYGKAEFYNKVYEVKSMGNYANAGSRVRIIKVDKNNTIYIELLKD